jgi:hypothetical protein
MARQTRPASGRIGRYRPRSGRERPACLPGFFRGFLARSAERVDRRDVVGLLLGAWAGAGVITTAAIAPAAVLVTGLVGIEGEIYRPPNLVSISIASFAGRPG